MRSAAFLLTLAGCSKLAESSEGVVALELRAPLPAGLEAGDTVRLPLLLQARGLDARGDSVGATIRWRTTDTVRLKLDSVSGVAWTDSSTGSILVQAHTGSIFSDTVRLGLRLRSDTLILSGPDTVRVASTDSASGALAAEVRSLAPPGGVSGTTITYEVYDPAGAQGTVHFAGGGLALRTATDASGGPVVPVTLRRTVGATPPDTVRISIRASRPSGVLVPGSGPAFVVVFGP